MMQKWFPMKRLNQYQYDGLGSTTIDSANKSIKLTQTIIKMISMHGWQIQTFDDITCYIAGKGENYRALAKLIGELGIAGDFQALDQLLRDEKSFFSYIIVGPKFVFACVDRIKSYPIFYGMNATNLFVSNCPYTIKHTANLTTVNQDALLEYSMASYVFGENTLYESLYQLQAGEYLLWRRDEKKVVIHRYYRYVPNPDNNATMETLQEEQATIMDRVIEHAIIKANGRPIWVPLSAGLDSRFIVAKLVEKNYDRIQTFSYGLRGNFEAKRACQIAKQLNVPWFFVAARPSRARKLYKDPKTVEYAKLVSALYTVPGYMEYEALITLKRNHLIPNNAFIINGQSGDFITGGHLPREVFFHQNPIFDDFFSALIKKHCSCWFQLLQEQNLAYLKRRIMASLPATNDCLSLRESLLAKYESWEWQERQCKAVVKGQRLYDWLGFDWDLPLWHPELMDFWEKVPFKWKINQELYIKYLQDYNYKNVFSTLRCDAKPWVAKFRWIPLTAKLLGIFLGEEVKKAYYQRMYYYATDYYQYALIGRKYYRSHYKNARGLGPFLISHCLDRMDIIDESQVAGTKPAKK